MSENESAHRKLASQTLTQQERYSRLVELLNKWIREQSPYDEIVMAELRKADDLIMRCSELTELDLD